MCKAFNEDDMSADPLLATATLQRKHASKVQEKFGPVMERYTTDECVKRLSKTDILCAPVMDLDDTLKHPQTLQNDILREVEIPGHGTVQLVGNPVKLAGQGEDKPRPPSALGEFSREILSDFDYSESEIRDFQERGVIT